MHKTTRVTGNSRRTLTLRGAALLSAISAGLWLVGCGSEQGESAPPPDTSSAGEVATSAEVEPVTEPPVEPAEPAEPIRPNLPEGEPLRAEGMELLWAAWGDKELERVVDSTELARTILRDRGNVTASLWRQYDSEVGDPDPGVAKWLTFAMRTPGGVVRGGLHDNSVVYVEVPVELVPPFREQGVWKPDEAARANELLVGTSAATPPGVVWSRWGNDGGRGGWGDAHGPISEQIAQESRIYNKRSNLGIPRPNRMRSKTLRFLASFGGQPLAGHLRQDSYLDLAPSPEEVSEPEYMTFGPAGPGLPQAVALLEGVSAVADYEPVADGSAVLVLDGDGSRVLRVVGETLEVEATLEGLEPIYADLAVGLDGQAYVGGPVDGFDRSRQPSDGRGKVLAFDPASMSTNGAPIGVRCDVARLGVIEGGRFVALHGSGNGSLMLLDASSGVMLAEESTWGQPDAMMVHADGRRVYLTDNNHLTCRWFREDAIDSGGRMFDAVDFVAGQVRVKGAAALLSDGEHVLSTSGSLVRLSNSAQRHLLGVAELQANSGGVISETLGALVLAVDGGLQPYAWPTLQPLPESRIKGQLTDLRLAPGGTFAWARWLPDAQFGRDGPTGASDSLLVRIDLAALLPDDFEAPVLDVVSDDADATIDRRLPLRTDLASLLTHPNGSALFVLDVANGYVLKLDPETLDVVLTSERLPFGARQLAVDPRGERLFVSVAPMVFGSNTDRENGALVALDPETLAVLGTPINFRFDPFGLAVSGDGRAFVSGGSNQWTDLLVLSLDTGTELGRKGGLRQGTSIALAAGDSLLLTSTSGLSPASVAGVAIDTSAKPSELPQIRVENERAHEGAGGAIWATPDGRFAAARGGAVYEVKGVRGRQQIEYAGKVETVSGLTSAAGLLIIAHEDGTLIAYESRGVRPRSQVLVKGVLSDLVVDQRGQRLFAIHRPDGGLDRSGRSEGGGLADVVSIDLGVLR